MTPADAIGPSLVEAATRRLATCPDFVPRLRWWLRRANSTERWIQFEWAYRLEQELPRKGYIVVCEQNYVDISLFEATPTPYWTSKPAAQVELKWWGNWWVEDSPWLPDLERDLNKVDGYRHPGAALLLFLRIDPGPDHDVAWIADWVTKGKGVRDEAELERRFLSKLPRKWDSHFFVDLTCGLSFASATLHGYTFYNDPARIALKASGAIP